MRKIPGVLWRSLLGCAMAAGTGKDAGAELRVLFRKTVRPNTMVLQSRREGILSPRRSGQRVYGAAHDVTIRQEYQQYMVGCELKLGTTLKPPWVNHGRVFWILRRCMIRREGSWCVRTRTRLTSHQHPARASTHCPLRQDASREQLGTVSLKSSLNLWI